ncbi:MAG: T9SS type A sorting domain-containing protein [Reichenbachiella sp.]|uniref:T9SS type A sorting domain-containing protein n=1 Tax=Reichenbachiella sp. TaxID=2184521 RepID=UPI0029676D11|nr:T9SS type A sorting domain-containing protein [Reichenbachiella sp.]MDW3211747.1 T9SS type A sorting domain-containing protein [Reichenbachiella sp.]
MKHLSKILLTALLLSSSVVWADKVLMFVSHEQTYYSEYIVMKAALEAAGHEVDVRSASTMDFSIYMTEHYADIPAAANAHETSNYSDFQSQFNGMFGQAWNETYNTVPASDNTTGSLLDVESIDGYIGIVVVGGTGSLDYRVDGAYASQGTDARELSATVIENTATHLNDLAIEALLQGKPVMAQCHGASIPAFWRIPDTSGSGHEVLGFSLLKGQISAGFPEGPGEPTGETLENLGVTYNPDDRVTIASPHSSLNDDGTGDYRIITTRDWFPQTVAHAARTFLNIIDTYPSQTRKETAVKTLILHGGAIDAGNCGPGNKENDVPCNHGGGDNLPADYTHLLALLNANGTEDDLNITTDHLDVTGTLVFNASNEAEVLAYLKDYDVVVFFKHWSNYITDEMLQAIVTFADDGGGVVGLHHALYNDQDNGQNKDVLVSNLFGAESSNSGWAANLATFDMYATDHGHFVSTYGVTFDDVALYPDMTSWNDDPLPAAANGSFSTLPHFEVYDELYINFDYSGDIPIGRGVNHLTPLFSNNAPPPIGSASQTRQAGFTQYFDGDEDGMVGKVAYIALGERRENMEATSTYGQIVRNLVVWAAPSLADKLSQYISMESFEDKMIGDPSFNLSASVSSGLPLTYSVTSGPASVDQTGQVTLTGVSGIVFIKISQAGNDVYEAAEKTVSFKVLDPAKQSQEITFNELSDREVGDEPFDLEATSSSSLLVSFSIIDGPATLSGMTVTLTGTGTVTIEASQPGNDTYNPATSIQRSFVVSEPDTPVNTLLSVDDSVDGIRVFPNPTKHWVHVQNGNPSQARLSIYSINGIKMLDYNLDRQASIDVSTWKPGVYLMKVIEQENITTTKILIER